MAEPHSRTWYEAIATTYGGYFYPWRQKLEGKSGETLFDELLSELLQPSLTSTLTTQPHVITLYL